MKILEKYEDLCIACHACEDACSKAWFKEENREKASLRINEEDTGINMTTCTQCGECIDVCPVEAIYRDKNGIVRIKKDICVGCFICVGFCPEGAMFQHDDHMEPFKCVACGICANACPAGALEILETAEATAE